MVKIKPTKIFSLKSWNIKAFSSPYNFFKFIFALITVVLSIILIYFLYRWANKAIYMYRLKTDFDKLRAIGMDVKNISQ